MNLRRRLFVISLAATLMIATVYVPPAGAAIRPVVIRPYFYGPAWYYPWPHAYWGRSRVVVPQTGDVKIETHLKDAAIYVDGGYAGVTAKLKEFSLRPGNHDIEVRNSAGTMLYHDRVQVIVGKTTEIKLMG